MNNITKIKFGANEEDNRRFHPRFGIFAMVNGQWVRVGQMVVQKRRIAQPDGTMRRLAVSCCASLDEKHGLYIESILGCQSAASAKKKIKAAILEDLCA